MDTSAIFTIITRRNALRREAQLPLLDVRTEFDQACWVARLDEWQAFCQDKQADKLRIEAEVLAEYRAKFGPRFPSNSISAIVVNREVGRRFDAFAAIHYGVQRPAAVTRHPVTYGGS